MTQRPWTLALLAPALLTLTAAGPQRQVYGPPPPPTPYDLCETAVARARTKPIPETLLPAIARVESGRLDPAMGRVRPWPWAINVEGLGVFFETKAEAIAAVQAYQSKGVRSIDIGCMQVNLFYHPTAFPTLDDAFDPHTNAAYAVRFLTSLFAMTKNWGLATAMYHSQAQAEGEEYQRKVFGKVMTPMGPPLVPKSATPNSAFPPASAQYGAFAPQGATYGAFTPPSAAYGAFAGAPSAPARR